MTDPQPPYPPPPSYPPPPPSYPPPQAEQQPGQSYGAPQYPYPPPGAGYPGVPPQQATTTSGFAIASLIFGIIGGVLFSVIFGIIALGKTKDGKQRGRGMAVAGLVLSGIWVALLVVAIVLVAVSDSGDTVKATAIKIGDCINTPSSDTENVASLPKIPCDQPHEGEVYAMNRVPGDEFPGQTALEDIHQAQCLADLETASPNAAADPNVDVSILYPTQETWDIGDRDVVCIAVTSTKRSGTLAQQFG